MALTRARLLDYAASRQTHLFHYFQDGPPAQWEERLAGYFLLLTAGTLVPELWPQTFDAFLIEACQLAKHNLLQG
jgi:hypothetical protein